MSCSSSFESTQSITATNLIRECYVCFFQSPPTVFSCSAFHLTFDALIPVLRALARHDALRNSRESITLIIPTHAQQKLKWISVALCLPSQTNEWAKIYPQSRNRVITAVTEVEKRFLFCLHLCSSLTTSQFFRRQSVSIASHLHGDLAAYLAGYVSLRTTISSSPKILRSSE